MSPTRRSLLQQKAYRDGVRDGMRDRDKEPDKPLTLEDVGVMTTDEINADWERVQDALATNRRAGDVEAGGEEK